MAHMLDHLHLPATKEGNAWKEPVERERSQELWHLLNVEKSGGHFTSLCISLYIYNPIYYETVT